MGELSDKFRGRTKQAAGSATGNRDLQARGRAQENRGRVKGALENIKQGLKSAFRPRRRSTI